MAWDMFDQYVEHGVGGPKGATSKPATSVIRFGRHPRAAQRRTRDMRISPRRARGSPPAP
jgi:hypothetical protein